MNIGVPELLIILVVVLLILGPKRLPALGRSLGAGMRNFKDSITGSGKDAELTGLEGESSAEPLEGEVVREPRRQ